jgi:hypothetical protein
MRIAGAHILPATMFEFRVFRVVINAMPGALELRAD